MSTYEVIVLDLDGTLTNSKKVITPKTKEALMKAQRLGKTVVLASGRPTGGITKLAEELQLAEYGGFVLSFNGGRIIDCSNGLIVYDRTVPNELIAPIYEETDKFGLGLVTYKEQEIILGLNHNKYTDLEAEINHLPIREVENFIDFVDFPVNKLLLTGEPKLIKKAQDSLRQMFGEQLNIFRSEPFFLEIMPQSIDKAYSLGILLKHLNIDRSRMICCGDGFNDSSMIQMAGLGVAMANAQNEVKEVADYITASNDEDGVADVIYKFMVA